MKPAALPMLTRGLDVLAQEGALPPGSARVAHNVTLHNDGGFERRPGHVPLFALEGAHSLRRSPVTGRTLVAAGISLYQVDFDAETATQVFSGLLSDALVEYDDLGDLTFFCAPNVLGKITAAGLVRRPGVADLIGYQPTLAAVAGGLTAGTYGVAYSLLNDLGEESGISAVAFIELATGGGVALTNLQTASHVTQMSLYITPPNGTELYHHDTVAVAATASIADQRRQRAATRQNLAPMPGGDFVREFHGVLYVARGPWLYHSEDLDYGVRNIKGGWFNFGQDITVLEPVAAGIFVGFADRVIFLRGRGPSDFNQVVVSARGAIAHSGARVAADFFDKDLVPDRASPVACWFSDYGFVLGRADGTLAYPQADRLRLATNSPARVAFVEREGVKQAVFCLDSLNLGVGTAVDSTI